MRITSETKVGDHKGIRFSVTDGFLFIDGVKFTKNKIIRINEIMTLLEADSIKLVTDTKREIADSLWGPMEMDILDEEAKEERNTPIIEPIKGLFMRKSNLQIDNRLWFSGSSFPDSNEDDDYDAIEPEDL